MLVNVVENGWNQHCYVSIKEAEDNTGALKA